MKTITKIDDSTVEVSETIEQKVSVTREQIEAEKLAFEKRLADVQSQTDARLAELKAMTDILDDKITESEPI